jgi:hypothetical protein
VLLRRAPELFPQLVDDLPGMAAVLLERCLADLFPVLDQRPRSSDQLLVVDGAAGHVPQGQRTVQHAARDLPPHTVTVVAQVAHHRLPYLVSGPVLAGHLWGAHATAGWS